MLNLKKVKVAHEESSSGKFHLGKVLLGKVPHGESSIWGKVSLGESSIFHLGKV